MYIFYLFSLSIQNSAVKDKYNQVRPNFILQNLFTK